MFVVRSYSPFDRKWKERDKEIIAAAGRPTNFSGAGVARIHHWITETAREADDIKRRLETVPDVSVVVTSQAELT
jgi:hypothetical protein